MKKIIRELPHDKSYCYLAIVYILGKIVAEDSKVKRILWYNKIMEEIKHLV